MASYRNGRPSDAETLDRIFRTTFCDTFAHLYSPQDLEAFLARFDIPEWDSQLNDPEYAFRIAEADGLAAGYVKLAPMKLPVVTQVPAMLLDQIYILKEHHGTGIARELMDWAVDEARRRGANELYLTVFIENRRARRFYDRFEFESAGRYDFKVGNHVDEDIIMRKQL
jgi:GNAT superfamily N-acetyltransferase